MKKEVDVEVLIVVECDQTPEAPPSPELLARIRESIQDMDGVIETYLALSSSDIGALASWEESKIPQYVKIIRELEGVKNVEAKILVPLEDP